MWNAHTLEGNWRTAKVLRWSGVSSAHSKALAFCKTYIRRQIDRWGRQIQLINVERLADEVRREELVKLRLLNGSSRSGLRWLPTKLHLSKLSC